MNSYENFLLRYIDDLHRCCKLLLLLKDKSEQEILSCESISVYDKNLIDKLIRLLNDKTIVPTSQRLADIASDNENRYGTEKRMIIFAIDDICNELDIFLEEEEEE